MAFDNTTLLKWRFFKVKKHEHKNTFRLDLSFFFSFFFISFVSFSFFFFFFVLKSQISYFSALITIHIPDVYHLTLVCNPSCVYTEIFSPAFNSVLVRSNLMILRLKTSQKAKFSRVSEMFR